MAAAKRRSAATGDLPPRPECAPAWRESLLSYLNSLRLTLVIGKCFQAWHLGEGSVTDAVLDWKSHWPRLLPLPHPSPRNRLWLNRNPWFELEVVPRLRQEVARLIRSTGAAPPRRGRPGAGS